MKNALKKLYDCKIAVAAILTALMATLLFCIYDPIFGTNDDYIMSILVQHGDNHSIFLNFFLVSFNVLAQKVFTGVNMFMVLQIAHALLAFVTISYIFLSKSRSKIGLAAAFIFEALFLYMGVIVVQWTHTAVYLCAAGFSLLYYAFFCEKRKGVKIFQIIASAFFVIAGGCYRFIVFEVSLAIFLLMLACMFLETILTRKAREGELKKALIGGLKSFLGIVISIAVIVGMIFGARILSDKLNASERYSEFKEFNSARARINDYPVTQYEGNEEFYNSIGIKSQNDIATIRRYYYDRDFFTTERLQAISKFSRQTGGGQLSVREILDKWLDRFDRVMPFRVGHTALLVMLAVGVCAAAVLLFIFRNRLKLLFPILLTVAWVIFLYRFPPLRDNFPTFALAVVFVVSSYFYNRYYFTVCAVLSAAVFGLYEYQYLSRLSYRVTLTFFLPALVYLMVAFSQDRLRVKYRSLPVPGKRFVYGVISLFAAATIIFIGYKNYYWKPYTRNIPEPNLTIQNYINEHPSDIFVYNTRLYSAIDTSRDRSLRISDVPDNAVVFADWQISSYYYDDLLKDHGITKLFEEMIDNEHRHFILMKSQIKSVQKFYNQHYAEKGETIKAVMETEQDFNKYFGVYKIVTEKAAEE